MTGKILKVVGRIGQAFLYLLIAAGIVLSALWELERSNIAKRSAITSPEGIESLEKVRIGGIDQWISIRGLNKRNPVLLLVHGGPGSPQMAAARTIDRELIKDFVVVNWDQRGAGKTFSFFTPASSFTLEQFLSDTNELTEILKQRFGVPKIYISGHSWGSVLGAISASRHPDNYYAYIGVGQLESGEANEAVSYRFTLEEAERQKNERAIQELRSIGPPPYPLGSVMTQRKWLGDFGGGMFYSEHRMDAYSYMGSLMQGSPEYSLSDMICFFFGSFRSLTLMWPAFLQINLPVQAQKIAVPVYLMVGRHDYNTPWENALHYAKLLNVPEGHIFWFENSAHAPNFEEVEKFALAMRRVKTETYK